MWVDGDFQPFVAPGSGDGSLHGDSSKPHVPPIYELTHTYDKASNRLTRYNETATLLWPHRHEEFEYDGLHRVSKGHRGVRDGSFTHSPSSREWSLDMLGNWDGTTNWKGGSFGSDETRTHSDANELTSRTLTAGSLDIEYDKAGNLTMQEFFPPTGSFGSKVEIAYTYDAWNRLVKVKYGQNTRSEYQYNGLNWRVVKRADTSAPPDGELNQQRVMYYNAQWQLVEEFINDDWDDESADDEHDRRMQYVWGIRYIDDIVLRRQYEAEDIYGPGTITDTWYHCTDTLFSTVAILDHTAKLVERVSYDTYGNARHHFLGDLNGDGAVNSADSTILTSEKWGHYGVGDLNRDGIVNVSDLLLLGSHSALPAGQLSATDNIIGYAGYVFNAEMHGSGLYTVRYRVYSPELGRWLTRDPLGYVDGMGLYEYVGGEPLYQVDSMGLYPHFLFQLQDFNNTLNDVFVKPIQRFFNNTIDSTMETVDSIVNDVTDFLDPSTHPFTYLDHIDIPHPSTLPPRDGRM